MHTVCGASLRISHSFLAARVAGRARLHATMSGSAHISAMSRSASSEKLHMSGGMSQQGAWRRSAAASLPQQQHHHQPDVISAPSGSSIGGSLGSRFGLSAGRTAISSSLQALGSSMSLRESMWPPLPPLRVPGELWGAFNALSAATVPTAKHSADERQQRRSVATQAAATAAPAVPRVPEPEQPSELRQRLDFRPSLSTTQAAVCAFVATAVCVVAYLIKHPAQISVWYGSAMAALFAAVILATRAALLEHQFTKRLVTETDLATRHSRFRILEGINVHYKLEVPWPTPSSSPSTSGGNSAATGGANNTAAAASKLARKAEDQQHLQDTQTHRAKGRQRQQEGGLEVEAAHCYHGFGANTFSWSFVQARLAAALGVPVTAHDMPGFGLSQRVARSKAYTLECNGRLGRAVMDAELAERLPGSTSSSGGDSNDSPPPLASLDSSTSEDGSSSGDGSAVPANRVLIGHSLGAACVAAQTIDNPEGIAALVLVAPAIVALRLGRREAQREAALEREGLLRGDRQEVAKARANTAEFRSNTAGVLMQQIGSIRNTVVRVAAAAGYALVASLTKAVLWLAQPLLILGLRSSVRSRAFWERGLARAWYRKAGVTAEVVDNYRLPQLVRGWERGMLAFLRARVTAGRSFASRLAAAYHGREAMTQVERLLDVIQSHGIKVLIIHGENDALVPAANSRRLAAILPGARLELLPNCGHNPQEELPDQFVDLVSEFVADPPADDEFGAPATP